MAPRKLTDQQLTEMFEGDAAPEAEAKVEPLRSVIDLDALISAEIATATENVIVRGTILLFAREWTVIEPQNALHSFRMADLEHDPMALIDAMKDCIIHDQRSDFINALKGAAALPTDVLMKIVNGILEVAFARPTSPSKPSSRPSRARRK